MSHSCVMDSREKRSGCQPGLLNSGTQTEPPALLISAARETVYKLVAMYQRPPNPPVFDRHYTVIHLPMLRIIPGLQKLVVTRGSSLPWGGDPPYYVLTELHFPNAAVFDLAMISPQYHAVNRDMQKFAQGIVTLVTLWGA
jgi:uncharacterized protein (TIGR02118 family)